MFMINRYFLFFLFSIFLLNHVLAFGVGSPYYEKNPLIIKPGETKETYINLQNKVGGENLITSIEIESGKELVKIDNRQETYNILLGEEMNINLTFNIPENYKEGNYNVSFIVKTTSQNKGQLSLSQGIKIKIPIRVENLKNTSFGFFNILLTLISIILLIIIYILLRKYKKSVVFWHFKKYKGIV